MDYFEGIIRTALEADGYWVRASFKVELTREEKKHVGKYSMPRPEIDLVAFRREPECIIALEAKSFLDSPGVRLADLLLTYEVPEGRYKLFTCDRYRETVLARLHTQLTECGMATKSAKVQLGLAAGHVYQDRETEMRQHFETRGWFFWGPSEIKRRVGDLASRAYENDPAVLTAKLLTAKVKNKGLAKA